MQPGSPENREPGRRLNAFDIGCIVVSGILGVGIFFTPRSVARAVDSEAHAILAWVFGGGIALIGAFVFADLAVRVPGHGGTFQFVNRAFGRGLAFLYGWANWLVIQSGALVVIGLIMVEYAEVLLYGRATGSVALRASVTIAAILLFTTLNAMGLRLGSRVQNALSIAKTGAVFLLVVLGLWVGAGEAPAIDGSAAAAASTAAGTAAAPRGLLSGLMAAMLPVLFSYGGWQQGSFVGGVARGARTVSRGIVGGVLVIVLAYVSVNLAFFGLLGFDGARTAEAIGAAAARAALTPFGWGTFGERLIAGMVVVSALGIMNTICLAPPFVLHAMAKEGLFFASVGRLHATRQVPVLGVLAQGLWAVLLCVATQFVFAVDLGFLVDGVVFVDWIFYALCGAALWRLGARGRNGALALAFVLLSIAVAVAAIAANPTASAAGGGVALTGVVVYVLAARNRGPSPERGESANEVRGA